MDYRTIGKPKTRKLPIIKDGNAIMVRCDYVGPNFLNKAYNSFKKAMGQNQLSWSCSDFIRHLKNHPGVENPHNVTYNKCGINFARRLQRKQRREKATA